MIALDANLVVRLLVGDHPVQARQALELMESGPTYISKTVLLEVAWVLGFSYDLAPADVVAALDRLMDVRGVQVEGRSDVELALNWARQGMEVADALHVAAAGRARRFATFDRRLARRAERLHTHPPVALAGPGVTLG